MLKLCLKCNKKQPEEDFNWKIKDTRRATYCKSCSRKYIRKHYKNNRKYYLEKTKKRNLKTRKEVHSYIGKYFSTHPCVDCGEDDILVLEFDHKNRSKKIGSISHIIRIRLPIKYLKNEIEKCDVRCANCHRRKTEKESSSWKLKYTPA